MYFGFKDVSVSYGKKTVLTGLTLEVPKGKIVTLIGKNGCGKSTLLKVVPRAVTLKSGAAYYMDKVLKSYPPKMMAQKIAYLSQIHTSPPDISIRTLVSYGRYPYSVFGRGLSREDGEIIDRALSLTGLLELQDRIVGTLSGGERQRAWIAMAVAQGPEVLILDEPTTYLDVSFQVEVLELVRRLNRDCGMTILMVLHDLNFAARYSDLLCAMKNGTIHRFGTPKEIVTEENLKEIFDIKASVFEDGEHACPYFIPDKTTFPNKGV